MMHYFKGLRQLPKVLTFKDKLSLGTILLIIITTSVLWWNGTIASWSTVPVDGGVYTEGILAHDSYTLDLIEAKLTKIGLTYTDHREEIHGALAERWEITDNGKKYTFYLRKGVNAQRIAEFYTNLPSWQNISVAAGENNTVVFTLKQPFAPLLSFTSDPVVDQGPFKIEKETTSDIVFTANPDFILGKPHLQRIVLNFSPDARTLKASLQRQEILGADTEFTSISNTTIKTLQLTQQNVLLFNLEREPLNDKDTRAKIRDGVKLDRPLKLTLATNQEPELLEKANEFAAKAKKQNIEVSIKSLNPLVLERDVLTKRDYDLLLTTLNYGYDKDPYPYWHSSQIIPPGKNYSGYMSKEGDEAIEVARQTLDQDERQRKYDEFQRILEADIAGIFYPPQEFRYTISKRVKGMTEGVGVVPADRFTEVWKWHLKQKKQPK